MANGIAHRHPARSASLVAGLLTLCLMLLLGFALSEPAMASDAIQDYRYGYEEGGGGTSGLTDLEFSTDFACNTDGTTSGTLFVNPQCEADGLMGVFANVVCRIENLFGTILGLVYCAVQNAIIEPLLALLTLYVVIYGAMVLLGMVNHTFSEAITRVVKIGLVSAIAMNADVAIGVGYKFYISAAQTSVGVIFDVFDTDAGDGGIYEDNPAMQEMIAGGYMASPNHADESQRLKSGEHWLESIDSTVHKILGFFVEGGIGFVIVMAGLFVFMPPLFLIVVYLILSILKAFAQAIIGYLLALLGITFLFTVAPIFVSFALFRVTAGWFEVWLKHLASFTLQLMIVFTFFMIMLMIDLVTFFQNIGLLVRQYQHIFSFGFIHIPVNVYTLCEVKREGGRKGGEIVYYSFDNTGQLGEVEAAGKYAGFPACVEEYTIGDVIPSLATGPIPGNSEQRPPIPLDEDAANQMRDLANDVRDGNVDIPDGDQIPPGYDLIEKIITDHNHDLKIPFFELLATSDLIFFLLVRFLVVIVLTYLLDSFMKNVPSVASYLAGTDYSGRLGGGEDTRGAGVQETADFGGVDTGFARFKAAAFGGGMFQRGFIRSAPSRFAHGMRAAAGGVGAGMRNKAFANAGNLGLRDDLRDELSLSSSIREDRKLGISTPDIGGRRGLHTHGRGGGRGGSGRNTMWGGR